MNAQKQIIVLIIVAASLASFLAGYLLTRPAKTGDAVLKEQRSILIDRFNGVTENTTPTPLPPGLLQATSDATLAPINASDANAVLYYHPDSGYVSRLNLETRQNTLISRATLPRLTKVIWSPDKNRVITVSRTAAGSSYAYFDYTTHQHGNLGPNIKDVVFSPNSNHVALVRSPTGGDSAIQIADFDGQNSQTILKTRLDNIKLSWPSEHTLAFTASDADASTQSLYTLNESGDLSQLVSGEDNLIVRWSSVGSKLLYSSQENNAVRLYVFDIATQVARLLPIQIPAANCAWTLDQKSIFCAIETGGETSILKISLANLGISTLFSNLIITPQEVFLSHLEDFLVIVSATDQSLWAVKLAP